MKKIAVTGIGTVELQPIQKKRMFEDHNVPKKEAWWITRNAESEQNARDTEKYLINLGFDGGDGGGDSSTIHVYAYKKLATTIE